MSLEEPPNLKPRYERSWAVVVGIDNYKPHGGRSLPALYTAVRGARAVARLLQAHFGFTVALMIDEQVTREAVMGELDRLAREAGPDDRFLFYFAGHGLTRKTRRGGEVGYLSLHDSRPGQWSTLLKMDDVLEQADFIPAKHILFVLDSCFSGLAFTRAGDALAGVEQRRLAHDFLTHTAIQAISAGRAGEYAADSGAPGSEHSLFTGCFLQGLMGDAPQPFGLLRAGQLAPWLQEQVRAQARARQTPQYGHLPGSGQGDFIFSGWEAAAGDGPVMLTDVTPGELDMLAGAEPARLRGAPLPFEPAWVEVPPGPFVMGSAPDDTLADDNEKPAHTLTLAAPFLISRAPITNREYAAFVTAAGHRAPRHWSRTPALSEDADLPVAWVSWDDAAAYCAWLTAALRQAGRIPDDWHVARLLTEAEWECAARGGGQLVDAATLGAAHGRRYPWGDAEPDSSLANFGNNENVLTPVGAYSPQGDSSCGCVDMAGNVWEWTLSLERPYPYAPTDGREAITARGQRVLRGGAFNSPARDIRAARRRGADPNTRDDAIGFRVLLVRV